MKRKVAFVTGASRGIGKALALGLAEAGYDVVLTARTVHEGEKYDYSPTTQRTVERAMPGSINKTAEEVRKLGREALPIRLDLLERASIDAAVEQALRHWGHIDVLVNNGIYQGPGLMDPLLDVSEDLLRRIFEGNFFAQIHLTRKVLPGMIERRGGIVVNMTSNAAQNDPPGGPEAGGWGWAYGASKGAFHRTAAFLKLEHGGQGIRAYNIDPGLIVHESQIALMGEDNPLVRNYRGAPVTLMNATIKWIVSDPDAAAMSGQTIYAQRLCKERRLVPGWPPPKGEQ